MNKKHIATGVVVTKENFDAASTSINNRFNAGFEDTKGEATHELDLGVEENLMDLDEGDFSEITSKEETVEEKESAEV